MRSKCPPFRYHVSLTISHPDLEPELITERLALIPTSIERKGEKITYGWGTPEKPAPEEILDESEWFHMFTSVDDGSLDACLQRAIEKLKEHQDFLQWIHSTEGRVKFHVNLYPPDDCGSPFNYERITELRRFGFGLGIHFYPERA